MIVTMSSAIGVGLLVAAFLALHLPEDPGIRYHDVAPFQAYFDTTHSAWPLKASAVKARFGAPNRYAFQGHFPWDLTTRANSAWVLSLGNG